jgi:hypothetical protein
MGEVMRRYWFPVATVPELDEDPIDVVRDPARNTPMIEIPRESRAFYVAGSFIDSTAELVPTAQRGL